MVDPKRYAGPVLGATATTVLFLSPAPYAYAPVVGALLAGGLQADGVIGGARAGAQLGAVALVGTTLVAGLVAAGAAPRSSGAQAYATGMAGSGPRNLVFYAVFAYSYAVYATLVGVAVASVAGGVRARGERMRRATE